MWRIIEPNRCIPTIKENKRKHFIRGSSKSMIPRLILWLFTQSVLETNYSNWRKGAMPNSVRMYEQLGWRLRIWGGEMLWLWQTCHFRCLTVCSVGPQGEWRSDTRGKLPHLNTADVPHLCRTTLSNITGTLPNRSTL